MKREFKIQVLLLVLLHMASVQLTAQVSPTTNTFASEVIQAPFVSDGQCYLTTFDDEGVAEFVFVFLGGNTYRIGAKCIGKSKTYFQLIDIQNNIMFDSRTYNYPNYWDFTFDNSQPSKVRVAKVFPDTDASAKQVEVVIGYKQFNIKKP